MAVARHGSDSSGKNRRVLIVDDMALLGFGLETPQALGLLRKAAEQK